MSVITPAKFDNKKLTVSDLKKLDNGAKQVYINYDGKRLRVQAPRMSVPYDSGDWQNNEKFKVQFSFKGKDSNPKIAAYYDMISAIDDYVIDVATKNAGKWFGMPSASREMISLIYSASIKYSKDKDGNIKTEYPPTQSVSLKKRNGVFDAEMYDDKNHLIEGVTPVEALRRGAEVLPVIDATGIWIAGGKFGLTWKLHQARIEVPGDGGAHSGFLGVDDEDAGRDSTVVVAAGGAGARMVEDDLMAAVLPAATASATATAAAESEDEDVDEDEVIPPPPVPKKVAAPAPAPAPAPAAAAAPAPTTTVKKVVKKVVKTT